MGDQGSIGVRDLGHPPQVLIKRVVPSQAKPAALQQRHPRVPAYLRSEFCSATASASCARSCCSSAAFSCRAGGGGQEGRQRSAVHPVRTLTDAPKQQASYKHPTMQR